VVALPAFAFYKREYVLDTIQKMDISLRAHSVAALAPRDAASNQLLTTEVQAAAPTSTTAMTAIDVAMAVLNRVIVFGLPIALYIWLIKYFIRLNQHNLLLAEDAAQRSAMIGTYVNLIAKEKAASETDRGVVLQAIFRPTISQATDNVDLPIVELVKAARG